MQIDNEFESEFAEETAADTQTGKFLIFRILDVEYGVEVRYVTDIVLMQRITPIPGLPSYIKGLMNLRGKIIPVMDVRLRLGVEAKDFDEKTSIIVVNQNEKVIGLIVDMVCEVIDLPESAISLPPQVGMGAGSRFIQALGRVGEEVKILLDVGRLLQD